MKKIDRLTLFLLGSWGLLLLISAFLFFLHGIDREKQVLFFPRYRSSECRGEERLLPRKDTPEQEIELLVREILLGPFDVDLVPVLPTDGRIRTVLLRNGRLYLDFSTDIVFQEGNSTLSFGEALDCVGKSVMFNFPQVEEIIYTVNGNRPAGTEKSSSAAE